MTGETKEVAQVDVGRTWATIISIGTLLFNAGTIVYLLLYGVADNSLHASALSWSYFSGLAVLAGIGIGAISVMLPAWLSFMKK